MYELNFQVGCVIITVLFWANTIDSSWLLFGLLKVEKLLLKLNLILEIPWSWGYIIRDVMVFLVDCLGLNELLWLYGWVCFCIISVPDSIHCKCWLWMWGSWDRIPLVTLAKAHLQYCCGRGGHVIQDLTPSPSWVHCQMWAAGGGGSLQNFWFLVCICNPTPKVDCNSTTERGRREISFGAASTHRWCCPLSTKSSFWEVD